MRQQLMALWLGLGMIGIVLGVLGSRPGLTTDGPLRFVDENGSPLANSTIRLLCYTDLGSPLLADLWLQTDELGYPAGTIPPACHYLAALHLLHSQPSGKPGHGPAFQLFATSWVGGATLPQAAGGDIVLSRDQPLVIFNVVASLAWTPAGADYQADFQEAIRQAAAYLYDLSEGQMIFGPLTLYPAGPSWNAADFRLLPANDYRPTAFVGGIVPAGLPYTATNGSETHFTPAEIWLGRYWDGQQASTGDWSAPAGYRTLVHEWSHYALFLYDEYQQGDGQETYCTCPDLPEVGQTGGACGGVSPSLAASVMAYHYSASEWWRSGSPAVCLDTAQWKMHGQRDWQTIIAGGQIQGLTDWLKMPASLTAGPGLGLAADLVVSRPEPSLYLPLVISPGSPTPPPSEPLVFLALGNGPLPAGALAQFYVRDSNQATYQGSSNQALTLLDIQPNDRARVYLDVYGDDRYVYPAPAGPDLSLSQGLTLTLAANNWPAALDLSYELTDGQLTRLDLILTLPQAEAPAGGLCTVDLGCSTAALQQTGSVTWTLQLELDGAALPNYGLVWVGDGANGELWRWYQLAGGVGPGHMDGHAPLLDGPALANSPSPVPGQQNKLLISPAADYAAVLAPLPAGIGGLVGPPLDLDILLPGMVALRPGDHQLPSPVQLTLFYPQEVVDQLGLAEEQLNLLHFNRQLGQWQTVGVSGRSSYLNWVASQPIQQDGLFAVGWNAAPPPQAHFIANPLNGQAPLLVTFINQSTNFSTSQWDFGDGQVSNQTNPVHLYEAAGSYTVTLLVFGPGGNDSLTRFNYIVVGP